MEMTFKMQDGMLVAEVDDKTASEFGMVDGRHFVVVKTETGFALEDAETVEDMAMIEQIMEEDDDVLRRLAQ